MNKPSRLEAIAHVIPIQIGGAVVLPIDTGQLQNFKSLVRKPAFRGEYGQFFDDHGELFEDPLLYIFAAYSGQGGEEILGLPRQMEVRAIADGTVSWAYASDPTPMMSVSHQNGISSAYVHVVSLAKENQNVSAGQVIGFLDDFEHRKYGVPHMQFRLYHHNVKSLDRLNPASIFPELKHT